MDEDQVRKALQNRAYVALNSFFAENEDKVVEIEVLPSGFEPTDGILMRDGTNIGIPKKVLALAFVEARHRFLASLESDDDQTCLEASRIILLLDPEHITAANFRKRRLLREATRNTGHHSETYSRATALEMKFLNSILTSPLHRQSKSPTLWHHRFWVVNQALAVAEGLNPNDTNSELVKKEIEIVCKAGERHPKNYYAWQYARKLLVKAERLWSSETHADVVRCWITNVSSWCRQHPSDISGWSFFLFLLKKFGPISERGMAIRQIVDYAMRFEFDNESLWIFIREALANQVLGEERERQTNLNTLRAYQRRLNHDHHTDPDKASLKRFVDAAVQTSVLGYMPST